MKKVFISFFSVLGFALMLSLFAKAFTKEGMEMVSKLAAENTAAVFKKEHEHSKIQGEFDFAMLSFSQSSGTLGIKEQEEKKEIRKEPVTEVYKEEVPSHITEKNITKGGCELYGIEINNETGYELKEAFSYQPPENNAGPKVLIVHTHTTESYRPSERFNYVPTDNSRTENLEYTVARVGEELADNLNMLGVETLHDKTVCDFPSYNGSYKKSMELIEAYLEKYPSLEIVLDIHRDAMERDDGTKISTVCNVGGEKAAQIMLVSGTNENGLSHDNWQRNFSFAVKLQQKIAEICPDMIRPLNVRSERFNGHVSDKHVIIEMGTTGNTLDEALVSTGVIAAAIKNLYN